MFADSNYAGMSKARKIQQKFYIGEWMARLGVSREEIMQAADIKKSYMSSLFGGSKTPSLTVALAIAGKLGIDVQTLRRQPPPMGVIDGLKGIPPEVIAKLAENGRSKN